MEDKWVIQLQRKEDVFLMTALSGKKWALTSKMMKRINACRLFLQVITLADICDGSGSFVTGNILKGQKHIDRRSRYEWASQAYPSSLAWRLWNTMLRKCFCRNKTGTAYLRHPLGRWLSPSPKHHMWLNYVNPNNRTLVTIPYGSAIFCTHEQAYTSQTFHRRFVTCFTRPKKVDPSYHITWITDHYSNFGNSNIKEINTTWYIYTSIGDTGLQYPSIHTLDDSFPSKCSGPHHYQFSQYPQSSCRNTQWHNCHCKCVLAP